MRTPNTVTGPSLRRHRMASGITIAALARVYGCTWTNIALIEGSTRVSIQRASRYLEALTSFLADQPRDPE